MIVYTSKRRAESYALENDAIIKDKNGNYIVIARDVYKVLKKMGKNL